MNNLLRQIDPELEHDDVGEVDVEAADENRSDNFCRIEGCGREARYRGLCETHRKNWIASGRPSDWPVLPRAKPGPRAGFKAALEIAPAVFVETEYVYVDGPSLRVVRSILAHTEQALGNAGVALEAVRRARSTAMKMDLPDLVEQLDEAAKAMSATQVDLRVSTLRARVVIEGCEEYNRVGNESVALQSVRGGRIVPKGHCQ